MFHDIPWVTLIFFGGQGKDSSGAFTEAMQSEWHHITSPLRIAESKSTELDTFYIFIWEGFSFLLAIKQTRDLIEMERGNETFRESFSS